MSRDNETPSKRSHRPYFARIPNLEQSSPNFVVNNFVEFPKELNSSQSVDTNNDSAASIQNRPTSGSFTSPASSSSSSNSTSTTSNYHSSSSSSSSSNSSNSHYRNKYSYYSTSSGASPPTSPTKSSNNNNNSNNNTNTASLRKSSQPIERSSMIGGLISERSKNNNSLESSSVRVSIKTNPSGTPNSLLQKQFIHRPQDVIKDGWLFCSFVYASNFMWRWIVLTPKVIFAYTDGQVQNIKEI